MAWRAYNTVNGQILGETSATGARPTDYLTDALGSVVATASKGTIQNTYRWAGYGQQVSKTGASPDPKFLWVGGWGYRTRAYIRKRTLDIRHAIWISVDNLWPGEPAYSYVAGKPTNLVDMFGEAPCDKRTDKYCQLAKEMGYKFYGYNCFCRVSGMVCNYIKMPCYLLPAPLQALCEKCKPWAECINKCLFDCAVYHRGCSPSTAKCWDRALQPPDPLFGVPGSPCMQIWESGCIRWEDDKRHDDCCRSMTFCEQEQLGYCNSRSGPCGPINGGCSKFFEEVSKFFGFDFPFARSDADRQKAAYRLCCRKRVWQEPFPGTERIDIRPFGAGS